MAIHSSILAWEIPRTEEPGGLQTTGSKELDTTEQLIHTHTYTHTHTHTHAYLSNECTTGGSRGLQPSLMTEGMTLLCCGSGLAWVYRKPPPCQVLGMHCLS